MRLERLSGLQAEARLDDALAEKRTIATQLAALQARMARIQATRKRAGARGPEPERGGKRQISQLPTTSMAMSATLPTEDAATSPGTPKAEPARRPSTPSQQARLTHVLARHWAVESPGLPLQHHSAGPPCVCPWSVV